VFERIFFRTARELECVEVVSNAQVLHISLCVCFGESIQYILAMLQHFTLRLRVKWDRTHRQKKKTHLLKKKINWLTVKKIHLCIENKLFIYKAVIKPIWSYGIELWGYAKSNIVIMQRSQFKILRAIANAPWYVTNHTLHTDFNILT
jgi:hypothetical protein